MRNDQVIQADGLANILYISVHPLKTLHVFAMSQMRMKKSHPGLDSRAGYWQYHLDCCREVGSLGH